MRLAPLSQMTSFVVRIKGLTFIVVLVVLGITVYTGVANAEGNEGGAAAVVLLGVGGIALHAALGVISFTVVMVHIIINHRVAVFHTKRIFAANKKGTSDPVPRLRGLIPILLLVSLALTIWTGFNSSEGFDAGGAAAEVGGEGGTHSLFIGLTALLLLGHMALNYKMILFQAGRILAPGRKKG